MRFFSRGSIKHMSVLNFVVKSVERLCAYFNTFLVTSCDHDLDIMWFLMDEYSRKHDNPRNCNESSINILC